MNMAANMNLENQMLLHDLKSPVQALCALIESAMDSLDREQIKLFNKAKSRASELLTTRKKKLSDFHVEDAINEVISEKQNRLKDIQIKLPKGNHFLSVERKEFQRVLSNIIDNAIDAIENKGGISIKTNLHKNHLNIHIRDTGKGIDDLTLMRILKTGGSFGKAHGSGLGLMHAKKSMNQWGGKLEIDSLQGHGTVVSLSFPLEKAPNKGGL
ncbi:MAG: ATP-binding protein [Deltaproteobacteria bacterium]|nr:MAG: ATP-binding protein [Deltaproteobacteria bacterium]